MTSTTSPTALIAEDDRDLFVVPDTWMDERFENNPLVIGAPRIRFYAGRAVHGPDGQPVGTLSVVDREPRDLSSRERLALLDLATLVEELIAPRVASDPQLAVRLESELEAARLMLEYTADVIVVLDQEAQVKFASPSFERQLGHTAAFRHPEGALALEE